MSDNLLPALPTLFASHGAPTLMIDPGHTGPAWQVLSAKLPRPRAILAVSAHWTTRRPAVSNAPRPETIHDFGGFPDELYRLSYPAPGAPDLARRVAELVPGMAIDSARGLDHGAWVPLSFMYPEADIPVTQLSVMPYASAAEHYALGQQLAPLTREGVLIMASGGLTHNLYDLAFGAAEDQATPYAAEFRDWLVSAIERHDIPAVLDYRRQAPHAERAHPSTEHLLPLFVALGAAGEQAVPSIAHAGYTFGALAMDTLVFTPAAP